MQKIKEPKIHFNHCPTMSKLKWVNHPKPAVCTLEAVLQQPGGSPLAPLRLEICNLFCFYRIIWIRHLVWQKSWQNIFVFSTSTCKRPFAVWYLGTSSLAPSARSPASDEWQKQSVKVTSSIISVKAHHHFIYDSLIDSNGPYLGLTCSSACVCVCVAGTEEWQMWGLI